MSDASKRITEALKEPLDWENDLENIHLTESGEWVWTQSGEHIVYAKDITAFEAEGDELADALNEVTACLESYVPTDSSEYRFVRDARAAIAKHKGEQ